MFHWAEISEAKDDPRFRVLETRLNEVGIENEFSFYNLPLDHDLREQIRELSHRHKQLRVGGEWRDRVKDHIDTWPATLLTLRSADALVCENNIWWPRNFLSESVQVSIASGGLAMDMTDSALIIGATPEARAVIHALVRVGYTKFILSDLDEAKAIALEGQLRQVYFNVHFQSTKITLLTQLPAATSIAVNTLVHQEHPAEIRELVYLNFLSPGGCWLDLSPGARGDSLDEEAKTVGAQVVNGWLIWARADQLWLNYILPDHTAEIARLEPASLAKAYRECFGQIAGI